VVELRRKVDLCVRAVEGDLCAIRCATSGKLRPNIDAKVAALRNDGPLGVFAGYGRERGRRGIILATPKLPRVMTRERGANDRPAPAIIAAAATSAAARAPIEDDDRR